MNRLDSTLPDFTRYAWVSKPAEEIWSPRILSVNIAFKELEILSVVLGQRECCLITVSPTEITERASGWLDLGLHFLPIGRTGISKYGYINVPVKIANNSQFLYQIALTRNLNTLAEFRDAWQQGDSIRQGLLLGYPSCCRAFFQRYWVDEKFLDTSWVMAFDTQTKVSSERLIEIDSPPQTNILWRWTGVRAIPYLPCSFDCKNTIEFSNAFWECSNYYRKDEYEWLLEMLSWPVEWSSLHGIAEIRNPIMKIITRSDATLQKYTVRKTGQSYPIEGAKGSCFPYQI